MKLDFRFLALVIFITSCNGTEGAKTSKLDKKKPLSFESRSVQRFNIDRDVLLKDPMGWYTYTYNNIHLGRKFISLDVDSANIEKKSFLDQLAGGKFVAFQTGLIDSVPVYQLHRLSKPDELISKTISQMAATEMRHEALKGKKLPVYNFIDLNGNSYDEINTKGKLLVVKCWFIRCGACIAEFPELNALVNRYKDRKDILFISLASDSKQELQDFLKKKKFDYLVVPDMGEYMEDQLQVNAYPMHLLIDKEGKILKSSNSVHNLTPVLEEEASLSSLKECELII